MTHFIMLRGGMIINVAHVRRVEQRGLDYVYIDTGQSIDEDQENPSDYYDPDGKIYAWFVDKAERVGGES